jgi:dihydroorotate dehydrogenase
MARWLAELSQLRPDPRLACKVGPLTFAGPVGLAAGLDKQGTAVAAWAALGFAAVEVGTVTPRPQPGNPRPRLFRLPDDRALINRFGFNSRGLAAFVDRLKERKHAGRMGIVGANVGKNKDTVDGAADYVTGIESVAPYADYIVCNISSPNTPGLRALQARAPIEDLLRRALAARARALPGAAKLPPLLVKIAPDLSDDEMRDVAEISMALNIDGIMIGRAAIGYPWIFREIKHFFKTGEYLAEPTISERVEVCKTHLDKSIAWKGNKTGVFEMRRHYANYFKGIADFKEYRMKLVSLESIDDIHTVLEEINERFQTEMV